VDAASTSLPYLYGVAYADVAESAARTVEATAAASIVRLE
jgi:hypothetical protein